MSIWRNFFGLGPEIPYAELVAKGAQIVDVRTPAEYSTGHIKGSVNIPLQTLPNQMDRLSKSLPVITCCASGARSGAARNLLLANGFTEVHNGGGWTQLNKKLGR